MELCGTSNAGFQKKYVLEENLTANYIKRLNKTNNYHKKFKEYKIAYTKKWKIAKKNNKEEKYLDDTKKFVEDMRPFNKLLKNDKITNEEYLEILNKRKNIKIY